MDSYCPLSCKQIGTLLGLGYSYNSIILAFQTNCKKDKQAIAILKLYKEWQKQSLVSALDFEQRAEKIRQEMKGEFLRNNPDNQKRFELTDQTGEILEDGKRPWNQKKGESELLVNSYIRLGMERKAESVDNCGSLLQFKVCPNGHQKFLDLANFCRQRLCPMCSWRKSISMVKQLQKICHTATSRKPLRWIFLTMTVKNVPAEKLSNTINEMMDGFDRFNKLRQVKRSVDGYFRAMEITYNSKTNTFHPHFHILLAVGEDYFDRKTDKYITQKEWQRMWKDSARLSYLPIIDIQVVKDKKNLDDETKVLQEKGIIEGSLDPAILEVAKYTVKPGEFLHAKNTDITDHIVSSLEGALKGRRLIGMGGLLNKIAKELNLKSVEDKDSDLTHLEESVANCNCSVCGSAFNTHLYKWMPEVKKYIG